MERTPLLVRSADALLDRVATTLGAGDRLEVEFSDEPFEGATFTLE